MQAGWLPYGFLATLLAVSLAPSDIYAPLLIAVVGWQLLRGRIALSVPARRTLVPLLAMLLMGAVFAAQNALPDIARDIAYGLKALACLLTGVWLGGRAADNIRLIRMIVLGCVLLTLQHLGSLALDPSKIGIEGADASTSFPLVSAFAVPLLLSARTRPLLALGAGLRWLVVAAIVMSFALSYSRTSVGSLVVILVACAGWLDNIKKVAVTAALVVAALVAGGSLLPSVDGGDITFLGKLQNSLTEISFVDSTDTADIMVNWRGFEAYQAFVAFDESDWARKLLGRGWGATVDLGREFQLSAEMSYQYVPILHNGYFHILTKYGLAGLGLFLVFLGRLLHGLPTRFLQQQDPLKARMVLAVGLIIVYTTLVITGIFNKERLDPLMLVLGWLLAPGTGFSRTALQAASPRPAVPGQNTPGARKA